jgi:signal transduction histidine kinase
LNRGKQSEFAGQSHTALEELSRLTGGLAHEIKNPLSTIKVNLKLISEELNSKDADAARAARKIAVVQKETDRLEQILEDFLRYIRKTELHPVSVDINQLISDMTDFYSPQAASRSITLRTALYNDPLICKADGDMLKQVLLNLFINAQQAMPNGGDLMLRTMKNENNAVIIVSDTGVGIEPENADKIFDAYYSTKTGGSGLGLSTSKKIIEAHNGSIKVDSVPQKGSSFTIQLPLEEKSV